ncbi:hypothetical protein [Agarilytica rhodophyticola]|uniref:hypothetical protein n=1 Tax=Agarilytica rhodophyticola TaxID=1737490 RepID=UPI000CD92B47|nr:hypothetical protein [Agarilytica rhodophyticola]
MILRTSVCAALWALARITLLRAICRTGMCRSRSSIDIHKKSPPLSGRAFFMDMAESFSKSSNQLFETLEEWNTYLEAEVPEVYQPDDPAP